MFIHNHTENKTILFADVNCLANKLSGAKLRIILGIKSKYLYSKTWIDYIWGKNNGYDVQNITEHTEIIRVGSDALWGHLARGVFTRFEKKKKILWNCNYIFLKMFFLNSGLILMSYITMFSKTTSFKTLVAYWWKLDGFHSVHHSVSFTVNITTSFSST